ncbi:MAG: hypothetical protein INF92_19885, partial [Rhodobacter sp.]|nr:hypothetical protein [Rhodobacter sp.]
HSMLPLPSGSAQSANGTPSKASSPSCSKNASQWRNKMRQGTKFRTVSEHLADLGFSPGVAFDANAGHLLAGRYLDHAAFSKMLGLAEDRVMVVDKGTPADATILATARDLGARVVSNDRFRDWLDQHPEAGRPGALIRGGFVDGALWLALDDAALRPVKAQAGSGP